MRRFHLALAVADVHASVQEYTRRLGAEPEVVVPGEYALWRIPELNLSIRRLPGTQSCVRHLGWEDPHADTLSVDHDINGLVWERFSPVDQQREIAANWPPEDRRGG